MIQEPIYARSVFIMTNTMAVYCVKCDKMNTTVYRTKYLADRAAEIHNNYHKAKEAESNERPANQ